MYEVKRIHMYEVKRVHMYEYEYVCATCIHSFKPPPHSQQHFAISYTHTRVCVHVCECGWVGADRCGCMWVIASLCIYI